MTTDQTDRDAVTGTDATQTAHVSLQRLEFRSAETIGKPLISNNFYRILSAAL